MLVVVPSPLQSAPAIQATTSQQLLQKHVHCALLESIKMNLDSKKQVAKIVQQENGPLLLALHPMTSVLMSALKGSGLMSQAWLLMSNAKNVPKENGLTKQDSH